MGVRNTWLERGWRVQLLSSFVSLRGGVWIVCLDNSVMTGEGFEPVYLADPVSGFEVVRNL